ncbi:MAG: chloramphenicol phosphotransferase CPT, partial [Ktedonobacterales bacterium]
RRLPGASGQHIQGVAVVIQVIILNGGSSSGKTTIATCLQDMLPSPWLRLSIDTLIDAMPKALLTSDTGIEFGADGSVRPGPAFRKLEAAWMQGIAAIAQAGARIILDDVFVSGVDAQNRWRAALADVAVLWVGVRCDPAVATEREKGRGDRVTGMAALQAQMVHAGIEYDMEVDTTETPAVECARLIAKRVGD